MAASEQAQSPSALALTGSATSLRRLLADHTRSTHEELHTHHRLAPLMSNGLRQGYYAALLSDYHAFYQAVEVKRHAAGWHAKLSLSRQIKALRADLTSLDQHAATTAAYEPKLDSQSECLGALYVLIGAQFGGHVIGAQIKTALPGVSCRYFSRHSDDITQWRTLLGALETVPETERSATLAGAKTTFEDFGAYLSS